MWFDKSTSTPQVLVVLEYFTLLLIRQDYTPLEDAPPKIFPIVTIYHQCQEFIQALKFL